MVPSLMVPSLTGEALYQILQTIVQIIPFSYVGLWTSILKSPCGLLGQIFEMGIQVS